MSGKKTLVEGIGINDANYPISPRIAGKSKLCPYYSTWRDMLRRVYNEARLKLQPAYKDCIVCEDWLIFSNFKAWMEQQDWKNKHLDKDILVQGNKVYSSDTCCFVPEQINLLITLSNRARGKYMLGVRRKRNKYEASIKKNSKKIYLGTFTEEREAHLVYKSVKERHVKEQATKYYLAGDIPFKAYLGLVTWECPEY